MWFALGAIIGIVGTIPLVALCTLFYRFPVPFLGYVSGPDAVMPALQGLVFYGVLFGGFIVQAGLGGIGGLAAKHYGAPDRRRVMRLCVVFSILGAALGVMTLALLDKIIGPW